MTFAQYHDHRKSPDARPDEATPEGTPRTRRAASPTRHLTAAQYARLLAFIDDAGIATVDGIARALPRVRQPVSAVFDLCDAGVLNADFEAAFDGDMRVWRIDG